MEEKNKVLSGADEKAPSRPQYFSWINNTNEGSTEEQTLINLEYFRYLKDTYGMHLEIYAWDAGNLDGSSGTYEIFSESEKLQKQYPNGYAPLAKKASEIGTRLGVWCGPDGFGDDEESVQKRTEQMVSLCRDLNFALFKIDGVCGGLSEEHQKHFVHMMRECRKYAPDLILLNHRLQLGIGAPYATTFLWQGAETYVDVFMGNKKTAPHHRAYFASRGNVPGLRRLTEDHGVCISSCIDYFEDDLIVQSFGRCLILAPEVYGNPWLMRDDEQAKLARIYNLHYRHRDILVNGMLLPGGTYPENAVSRGSATRRFLVMGNESWTPRIVSVRLDGEIGLWGCDRVQVCTHHPYERYLGTFAYGDVVDVVIPAFRSCLLEVCDVHSADRMLTGCSYEVVHEDASGTPDTVRILRSDGQIAYSDGSPFPHGVEAFDNTMRTPELLSCIPADATFPLAPDADALLERALFVQDQDSLEARSRKRSGGTAIPQVQNARDAFFAQKTYALRGPEARFAFDGKSDTFFDGISKTFFGGFRKDGGCIRLDLGSVQIADFIEFEYFDIDEPMAYEVKKQIVPSVCDFSVDLKHWNTTTIEDIRTLYAETAEILIHQVHNIVTRSGRRRVVRYPIGGEIRYFRMPKPLDRIYRISLIKDGVPFMTEHPTLNNLMPAHRSVAYTKRLILTVPKEKWRPGCYLSVGLEGTHGVEGAYAVVQTASGVSLGCPDRAPGYNANVWECYAALSMSADHHYTYYFPVPKELCDTELTVHILGLEQDKQNYGVNVYLCDAKTEETGPLLRA